MSASLRFVVVPRGDRASALRQVLDRFDPPRATVLASDAHAGAATRALASLGYDADDTLVRLRTDAVDAHEPLLVSFGAPQDSAELQRLVDATAETLVVFVAPEELASFLRLAGSRATPLSLTSAPTAARAAEDVLRDELRTMMQARPLHRETLALEPLLAEHDALQVAAAALRMLELEREKARAKRPAPRVADAPAVSVPTERVAPVGTTFTKLFINVGERDGAKKGDFVGAITGEAGVSAEQIGTIDLRDSHSIVEVLSDVAEKVIAALNGSTIRNRHVLAREDRGPTERADGETRGGFRGGDRAGFSGGASRGGPPRGKFGGGDRGDRSRPDLTAAIVEIAEIVPIAARREAIARASAAATGRIVAATAIRAAAASSRAGSVAVAASVAGAVALAVRASAAIVRRAAVASAAATGIAAATAIVARRRGAAIAARAIARRAVLRVVRRFERPESRAASRDR